MLSNPRMCPPGGGLAPTTPGCTAQRAAHFDPIRLQLVTPLFNQGIHPLSPGMLACSLTRAAPVRLPSYGWTATTMCAKRSCCKPSWTYANEHELVLFLVYEPVRIVDLLAQPTSTATRLTALDCTYTTPTHTPPLSRNASLSQGAHRCMLACLANMFGGRNSGRHMERLRAWVKPSKIRTVAPVTDSATKQRGEVSERLRQ